MRYQSVVKMHTVNRMQTFGWPLLIMLMALGVVIAIGAAVNQVADVESIADMNTGMMFNGAIFTALGPIVALGFISMGQFFPLALGLGITRREYVTGTALVFLGYAVAFTAIVVIGKSIELATGGYGLSVRFFDVAYVGTGPLWQTAIQTFLIAMMAMLVGSAFVAGYFRWRQTFVWTFVVIVAVVGAAIGIMAVLSPAVANWFFSLFSLDWWAYMALIVAVAAIAAVAWSLLVRRTQLR